MVSNNRFSRSAEDYAARIEAIRRELSRSQDQLGAWQRPWLATSPELRERLRLDQADDMFETSISVSKANEASKGERWCRVLMSLVLGLRPGSVVEMGTNVGISGLYIAAGLAANGRGRLVTMEGAPSKAVLASGLFTRLDVPAEVVIGDFARTLDNVLARAAPVDLAFIDGFHESAATLRYHTLFKHVATPGAVLIYDDINWSDGMSDAWREISADRDVEYALDYGEIGICGLRP